MKTKLFLAVAIAAASLVKPAAANPVMNITTFNVPYQVTNSSGAPRQMAAECALFIGRRTVSAGRQTFVAPPGTSSGSASIGMHWPLRENPARINQFACRIVELTGGQYLAISLPEPGGPFSLPHAGPRGGVSFVSGSWPQ